MKTKIIEGRRYSPVQVDTLTHADELLKKNKIIGYSVYDGMIIAYFPL